jgi:hypothetical protein
VIKVVRGQSNILGVKMTVENGLIYNLGGQQVKNGFKGLGIRNGKKVLMK